MNKSGIQVFLLRNFLDYNYSVADFLFAWSEYGNASKPNHWDKSSNSRWMTEVVDFVEQYRISDE